MRSILRLLNNIFIWPIRYLRMKLDPVSYARYLGVHVGRDSRIVGMTGGTFGSEPYLIELGDHVTVAARVQFITHDGGVWVLRQDVGDIDVVGPIKVGNNVFIGFGSIIMPNVKIGDNVVIGAGSVVTKDIPSDSIVVGVPAKIIQTIVQYKEKVIDNKICLSGMSHQVKREYLLSYFSKKS